MYFQCYNDNTNFGLHSMNKYELEILQIIQGRKL